MDLMRTTSEEIGSALDRELRRIRSGEKKVHTSLFATPRISGAAYVNDARMGQETRNDDDRVFQQPS